jgi:hypothetical protein
MSSSSRSWFVGLGSYVDFAVGGSAAFMVHLWWPHVDLFYVVVVMWLQVLGTVVANAISAFWRRRMERQS